jgi:hypothetical protein
MDAWMHGVYGLGLLGAVLDASFRWRVGARLGTADCLASGGGRIPT